MTSILDDDLQEEMDEFDTSVPDEPDEDELSPDFIKGLVDKILRFNTMFVGHALHPYQEPFARRIVESVLINDGEEVTALGGPAEREDRDRRRHLCQL